MDAASTTRREPTAPNHLSADLFVALIGLGLGATGADAVASLSGRIIGGPGGPEVAVGRVTGLVGSYLLLVTVLLMGRLPVIERLVGQQRLSAWHRRLAPWPLLLLIVHAVSSMLGYALVQRTGVWHELGVALSRYPGMFGAIAGLGLLIVVAVASIRAARERIGHETWWQLHLLSYLALALAFSHQVATGASFVHHPIARLAWTALWIGTAGAVATFRIVVPAWRTVYHRMRVVRVVQETENVYSVVVKGHRLDRLAVSGGQYFQWRFLTRRLWFSAHPYSLSALPQPPYLRVTIKAVGAHSRAIAQLRPGVRVAIEGPYGTMTKHAAQGRGLALIGAGIGVTPLRALLEDLPTDANAVVLLRASTHEELALAREVGELARARNARAVALLGSRDEVRLDAATLREQIPDLPHRDVYICGPDPFTAGVASIARRAGVPPARLHLEGFG
jgi:predicted ferric reductase